jgi:hypothetical protein
MAEESDKKSSATSSNIQPGDYALIITPDNEIEFLMPHVNENEINRPVPKLAIALAAIANLMGDDRWVDQVIHSIFGTTKGKSSRSKRKNIK